MLTRKVDQHRPTHPKKKTRMASDSGVVRILHTGAAKPHGRRGLKPRSETSGDVRLVGIFSGYIRITVGNHRYGNNGCMILGITSNGMGS